MGSTEYRPSRVCCYWHSQTDPGEEGKSACLDVTNGSGPRLGRNVRKRPGANGSPPAPAQTEPVSFANPRFITGTLQGPRLYNFRVLTKDDPEFQQGNKNGSNPALVPDLPI